MCACYTYTVVNYTNSYFNFFVYIHTHTIIHTLIMCIKSRYKIKFLDYRYHHIMYVLAI